MRISTLGVALGSLVLGAALALAASDLLARPSRQTKPSVYWDTRYGYSITPPAFPKGEEKTSGLTATFFAPARGGFSPNLGVMVQNVKMSAEEYRDLSRSQFKQANFNVLSETAKKVSGKDAFLWEYEGKAGERELRWMGLAVIDTERVYLVTATAPKSEFKTLAGEFKASLDSFSLGE
jgi:hypothetical protein